MPGDPRSGSKVWEAPDWEIGKPGENRSQVVAHWQSDPAAGFHDRENATFGPASGLPMCRCNGRAPELVREFGLEDRSLSR
jgi:hypothetical protein